MNPQQPIFRTLTLRDFDRVIANAPEIRNLVREQIQAEIKRRKLAVVAKPRP